MQSIHFSSAFFATISLVALAACDVDESLDPTIDQEFRTTFSVGCQSCNSPIVNDAMVNELNLTGLPSKSGITLISIIDPNSQLQYALKVDELNHEFRVLDGQGGVISGQQLVGWEIRVKDEQAVEYRLRIDSVERWPTWSDLNIDDEVVYRVSVWNNNVYVAQLCPSEDFDDQAITIIAGETYDRDAIEVKSQDDTMITLACVKEAAFKMKMLGYYPNSVNGDDEEQRQATLKMLTADYCGIGHAFTKPGTPVAWKNSGGSVYPQWESSDDAIEAIWDKDGALCLATPRHVKYSDVVALCKGGTPPLCDEVDVINTPHEWSTYRVP